jgi:nitric oxide reductase subunit C
MKKLIAFFFLFACYAGFSAYVYTIGTESRGIDNKIAVLEGKKLFQEKNCIACHQIYGLGGFLGPDLTRAYSDERSGPVKMRAVISSGTARMPDFKLSKTQIDNLMLYFKYVDQTGK